ncbi:Cytochrome b5 reductase 4, partial [Exaiptasia diaphana]
MEAPKLSFPSLNSPQRAASSGSVRAKVALKPGRSLMDWIKLGASGKDLTGVGGIRRPVTWDELSKHNTEHDCWMSVRGKVYNITPYLEYHPGGIPEIMKGAGKDGTALFDEIHKWVNAESMLEKCFIGPLDTSTMMPPPRPGSNRSLKKSTGSLRTPNSLSVPMAGGTKSLSKPTEESNSPRYDWYQNAKIITISVYTKYKDLQIEDVIIEVTEDKHFDAIVILGEKSYQIHLDLEDKITDHK